MAGKGLSIDENGVYWLKSPEARYRVEVEDVPFIITRYDIHNQDIDLYTNFDEQIPLGPDRKLTLREEPRHNVSVLYAEVRKGLWARFATQVYNQFVTDIMTEQNGDMTIFSRGQTFKFKIS